MELLRAEGGAFIPILIIWGVMMVLGRIQKAKKQAEQQREARYFAEQAGEPVPPAVPQQHGLLNDLKRAMEELKRVEAQQSGVDDVAVHEQSRAEAYLEARKRHVIPTERRPVTRRRDQVFVPQVHVPTFDEDGSIEGEDVIEGSDVTESVEERTDYDFESERQASERRAQTAVNWHDGQGPVDTLHTALGTPAPAPAPVARRGALARYADGTARGAVILSLILGPPKSES